MAVENRINRIVLAFIAVALAAGMRTDAAAYRDIYSDTWVAQDALGRSMPSHSEVGAVKEGQRRAVGIFYITWHRDEQAKIKSPYSADVSRILFADPAARLDAKHPLWVEGAYHHWAEPEDGYFLSKDEYIIRKDMSMLSDAGVDVLVMDVTNAVRYWDEWAVIFRVMQQMKDAGNRVPQFCFWAFNGPVIAVVQDLYDRVYKANKYKDLWFQWDGRPLLLYNGDPSIDASGHGVKSRNPHYDPAARSDKGHPHYGDSDYAEPFYQDYTQDVKNFFTLRTMWWGYWEWGGKRFVGTEDNWSFGLDLGDTRVQALKPDQLLSTHQGIKEEAAVTAAQHAISMIGKCWTKEHGEPTLNEQDLPLPTYVLWLDQIVENPEGYGIYFQDRWDEALKSDPQFMYINDWNEWIAGKFHPDAGQTYNFMRRENSPYRFVDQYNSEFNRCIQPMKGGYTDNYYMQMAQNIRRYKGVRPITKINSFNTITIDGKFDDWRGVEVEYRDTIGDTAHRDYMGYGGLHYTNQSGRNDITTTKVAVDKNNVFFWVETKDVLTAHTDPNWMLLLIDADKNSDTGWYGYDYLVNKSVIDDKHTTLCRYDAKAADHWVEVVKLNFRSVGRNMELSIPHKLLGLSGDAFTFDFHWCDNPSDLKDPISLCINGDSAPNRRFNYRCVWNRVK